MSYDHAYYLGPVIQPEHMVDTTTDISKKLINARIYRKLRKIQAELDAAGVCSRYKRLQLRGWDDANLKASWVIYFDAATLSNGDTWGLPQVELSQDAAQKSWQLHYNHLNFKLGVERIKQRFNCNRFVMDVPSNVCQRRIIHNGK